MSLTEAQRKQKEKQAQWWRDRETENREKYLKKDKEYLEELNDIYKYTMDQVQKEIDSFYTKYATKA